MMMSMRILAILSSATAEPGKYWLPKKLSNYPKRE